MACATRRVKAAGESQSTQSGLSSTQEDYLEAIYLIALKKHAARAKDISGALQVRASSVTSALRTLAALDLVNYTPYDIITLTDKGEQVAREIYARHTALRKFLITVLGVAAEDADKAACKMEHAVSRAIMERFIKYAEYIEHCPHAATLGADFAAYCAQSCATGDCAACKREEAAAPA